MGRPRTHAIGGTLRPKYLAIRWIPYFHDTRHNLTEAQKEIPFYGRSIMRQNILVFSCVLLTGISLSPVVTSGAQTVVGDIPTVYNVPNSAAINNLNKRSDEIPFSQFEAESGALTHNVTVVSPNNATELARNPQFHGSPLPTVTDQGANLTDSDKAWINMALSLIPSRQLTGLNQITYIAAPLNAPPVQNLSSQSFTATVTDNPLLRTPNLFENTYIGVGERLYDQLPDEAKADFVNVFYHSSNPELDFGTAYASWMMEGVSGLKFILNTDVTAVNEGTIVSNHVEDLLFAMSQFYNRRTGTLLNYGFLEAGNPSFPASPADLHPAATPVSVSRTNDSLTIGDIEFSLSLAPDLGGSDHFIATGYRVGDGDFKSTFIVLPKIFVDTVPLKK